MRSHPKLQNQHLVQRGFTLIELLVVIVILGVLAAVVVFAVGGITDKGKASSCTIEVRTVNTALQAFNAKSQTNAYPTGTVLEMFTALKGAGLLQADKPGASNFTPTYNATTGTYAASCPS